MSKITCYVARAMSGLKSADVVAAAQRDKTFLEAAGFTVLCPVTSEGVKPTNKPIQSSKKQMDLYWFRDKEMIEQANVVFNMSPHLPSLGVIREHGYARYFLYIKVISIFPEGAIPKAGAVCFYEDDYVTDSLVDAVGEALRTHGTVWKRLKWRFVLYNRCLPKMIRVFIGGWK